MSDYSRKISLGQNLAAIGLYAAQNQQNQSGWQLPCTVSEVNGSFVTVNFEVVDTGIPLPQIEVPIYGWEYIRYPIQVGDPGVTISIDTNLLNICGLSDVQTNLVSNGNFGATLMFLPIMSKKMSDTDDTQAVVIYGPNGVVIRDTDSNSKIVLTPNGIDITRGSSSISMTSTSITVNASTVNIDSSSGTVNVGGATNTVNVNGKNFMMHTHLAVQPGTGVSGGVSP